MTVYLDAVRAAYTRDPDETVDEWADHYRELSSESASEPGRWRTSRTPYLREIMRALSPSSPYFRVVFMAGSQLGKTECLNNWIGYTIHRSPAPMLLVLPTRETAMKSSKQRLQPMIDGTPVLRERVRDARTRDSGNTIMVKSFDGGVLMLAGANAPAGLRAVPVERVLMDEVDEYPGDVGGQGDPVMLAEKRALTFPRRKLALVSSPTIKGISRIEAEYLASDQRRYFVPCPECGAFDWMRWENIRWDEGKPDTAALACLECGVLIEERHKLAMLARGEWRATATGRRGVAGFHLSGLYSPWHSWARCVEEFLLVKDDPFKLKTWINTVLGETWEDRAQAVDPEGLRKRAERYAAEVPNGVGILVAAADVQGNRIEVAVKGYGAGEESWLIAFTQLIGDPAEQQVWNDLDAFLAQEFTHESGRKVRIERAVVDTGGAYTQQAYQFCVVREHRGIYAIKGGTTGGDPLVGRVSTRNRYKTPLWVLCVDTGKEAVMSRLRIGSRGPGYMHLPEWVDEEYLAQLTAEKSVWEYVKGRGAVRVWKKQRARNEALDLEVYCLAALYICGPALLRALPQRAHAWAKAPEPPAPAPAEGRPARPARRGWVDRWR